MKLIITDDQGNTLANANVTAANLYVGSQEILFSAKVDALKGEDRWVSSTESVEMLREHLGTSHGDVELKYTAKKPHRAASFPA